MIISQFLLNGRAQAKIYGNTEQGIDGRDDAGSGLIGSLILDQVGSFFVERYSGNASTLVLQLSQNQVGGSDIGESIGGIIAHFKYDAGIEIKRPLSIGHGLIVNRGEDSQISVAPGSAVGTGGNQGRVGDTDAQRGCGAHPSRGWRHEKI